MKRRSAAATCGCAGRTHAPTHARNPPRQDQKAAKAEVETQIDAFIKRHTENPTPRLRSTLS
jgi:hypothetical protein